MATTSTLARPDNSAETPRWAVATAAFGAVCVLVAAGALLAPIGGSSEVGGAVTSFVLFLIAAIATEAIASADSTPVTRVVVDVGGAGCVAYLAGAAGGLADAAGVAGNMAPLFAGLGGLAYGIPALLRRPGSWLLIATALASVVAALGVVGARPHPPTQAWAAALLVVAVGYASAAALDWLKPQSAAIVVSGLAALAAASVLLSDHGHAADVVLACLVLLAVAGATVGLRLPSLVAALALGAPVVVALVAARTGHDWWSIPLGMAWAGGGTSLLAAYVDRAVPSARLGGVFAWCTFLVLIASMFLANSNRLHACVALVTSGALFAAAAYAGRRVAAVLAGIATLGAVAGAIGQADVSRVVVLLIGVGLVYLAITAANRRPNRRT